MSDDGKDDSKLDTVPPPPGEDDAYNAPTRVGPLDPAVLEAMMASLRKPEEAPAATEAPAEEMLSESDLVVDPAPSSRGPSSPLQPRLSKPPPVPHRMLPASPPPTLRLPVEVVTAKPVDAPIEETAPAAGLPAEAPASASSQAPVFLLLAVGVTIFAVGVALYFLS